MNNKLILLTLVLLAGKLFAQNPVVIMQTSRMQGMPVKLDMRMASSGTVEIDWGGGTKMKYTVGTESTTIQGVLSGSMVSIYGKGVTFLSCADSDISSIDVSKATDLQQLYCEKNDLTALDVKCNAKLVRLGAHTNKLKDIDLSKNTKLTGIYLQNNLFDSRALNTIYNSLPKLKNTPANVNIRVTGNPGAKVSNTAIATDKNWSADVTGDNSGGLPIVLSTSKKAGEAVKMELRLSAAGNIEIDWGKGPELVNVSTETTRINGYLSGGNQIKLYGDNIIFIKCEKAGLTGIDVSQAQSLQQLYVGYNQLATVDVSKNKALTRLGINDNNVGNIDISNNSRLSGLYFQNNMLDACTLNKIYSQLPSRQSMPENVSFRITGNEGATTSNTNIATTKNWKTDVTGDNSGCK